MTYKLEGFPQHHEEFIIQVYVLDSIFEDMQQTQFPQMYEEEYGDVLVVARKILFDIEASGEQLNGKQVKVMERLFTDSGAKLSIVAMWVLWMLSQASRFPARVTIDDVRQALDNAVEFHLSPFARLANTNNA